MTARPLSIPLRALDDGFVHRHGPLRHEMDNLAARLEGELFASQAPQRLGDRFLDPLLEYLDNDVVDRPFTAPARARLPVCSVSKKVFAVAAGKRRKQCRSS